MTERREFEMTQEQLDELMTASKPVPYVVIGGFEPESPQQNANRAWQALADELGFVWDTVKSVPGKGTLFFTAEVAS